MQYLFTMPIEKFLSQDFMYFPVKASVSEKIWNLGYNKNMEK